MHDDAIIGGALDLSTSYSGSLFSDNNFVDWKSLQSPSLESDLLFLNPHSQQDACYHADILEHDYNSLFSDNNFIDWSNLVSPSLQADMVRLDTTKAARKHRALDFGATITGDWEDPKITAAMHRRFAWETDFDIYPVFDEKAGEPSENGAVRNSELHVSSTPEKPVSTATTDEGYNSLEFFALDGFAGVDLASFIKDFEARFVEQSSPQVNDHAKALETVSETQKSAQQVKAETGPTGLVEAPSNEPSGKEPQPDDAAPAVEGKLKRLRQISTDTQLPLNRTLVEQAQKRSIGIGVLALAGLVALYAGINGQYQHKHSTKPVKSSEQTKSGKHARSVAAVPAPAPKQLVPLIPAASKRSALVVPASTSKRSITVVPAPAAKPTNKPAKRFATNGIYSGREFVLVPLASGDTKPADPMNESKTSANYPVFALGRMDLQDSATESQKSHSEN